MKTFFNALIVTLLCSTTLASEKNSNACVPVANEMTCQLIGGSYEIKTKLCCLKVEMGQELDFPEVAFLVDNY